MKALYFTSLLLALFVAQAPLSDGVAAHGSASGPIESLIFVAISPPGEIVEGRTVEIECLFFGPAAESCALIAEGELTRLGQESRGRFTEVVSEAEPVECALGALCLSAATFDWTPEWFDAQTVWLKVKFFARDGSLVGMASREFAFWPSCLAGCDGDCVVISKAHQRLYAVRDGELEAVYLVSTGTRCRDGGGPTPAMTTQIVRKTPYAYSRRYESPMYFWNAITADGAYGIHATVPSNYPFLGRPASHGCIRLHRDDAKEFYQSFPTGTTVLVSDL